MSKEMYVQIRNEQVDVVVTISAEAPYSPDIIDDLKRRAIETYRDAVALRSGAAPLVDQKDDK